MLSWAIGRLLNDQFDLTCRGAATVIINVSSNVVAFRNGPRSQSPVSGGQAVGRSAQQYSIVSWNAYLLVHIVLVFLPSLSKPHRNLFLK